MSGPVPFDRRSRGSPRTVRRRDVAAPEVELSGIGKRFPGVVANHDVDLTIRPGTVHALDR